MNRNRKKVDVQEIGLICCNCGSDKDVQWHHIVPLSIGGNDITSNKCCLCYNCHSLLHFGKIKNISHSELTKAGILKAKRDGKQIGQRPGAKLTTKKSIAAKADILKYSQDFGGALNDTECMRMIGITRNTYYKYKKELQLGA